MTNYLAFHTTTVVDHGLARQVEDEVEEQAPRRVLSR
jgi:hypothetical protein